MNGDSGFTQIPNDLLMALSRALMQGAITSREMAVINFIIRNTYGYHKVYNNLKTSFIAKELGTTPDYISHILKRLEKKNIIVRDGNEILFNKHYNEWKNIKLPYHKSELFKGKVVNSINIVNSINKTLQTVSTGIVNSINIDTEQKQSETNSVDPLNITLLNKTLNKEERNVKERKIIKDPFLKEKDFKDKEEGRQGPTARTTTKTPAEAAAIAENSPAKIIFNNQVFKFENIPKGKLEKWKEAFPRANIEAELKKMEAWLAANPKNKKENYERFIINWLGRADDRAVPKKEPERVERTGFYDATGRRID